MGVQRLRTISESGNTGRQWMFPIRNIENAKEILHRGSCLDQDGVKNMGSKLMFQQQLMNLKETRQTVLKISSGSNIEERPVKEERILTLVEFGQEKRDVSKEEGRSLSLDWQGRAVKLYKRGKKIKTIESALEDKTKGINNSPALNSKPTSSNKSLQKVLCTKNDMQADCDNNSSEKNRYISTCNDLKNSVTKYESRKTESDNLIYPVKNENTLMKKKMRDETNWKMRNEITKLSTDGKFPIENKNIKNSKNDENEKLKENSISQKDQIKPTVATKVSFIETVSNKKQETTEKEENKKVLVHVPVKKKDDTYITRLNVKKPTHTHPLYKVKDFIVPISTNVDDDIDKNDKEKDFLNIEYYLKPIKGIEDEKPGCHIKEEVDSEKHRAPMIDLHAVKRKIQLSTYKKGRQNSDGHHNGHGDSNSGASNGTGGSSGSASPNGGGSGFSSGGFSPGSSGFSGAGAGDGDGSRDRPNNSFVHKDGPGDTDNPDRDKDETDVNGVSGQLGYKRHERGSSPTSRPISAARGPGYVKSTVAQFSPPKTPPRSPNLQRVKGIRGRSSSRSPPPPRRSCAGAAAAAGISQKHGTIEALEGYDIYSAFGLLVSEEKEDEEKANIVLKQFNICLPKSIRSNHRNFTDGCTICSLLTSLLKHSGRCILSRKKGGCLRCRQVDAILQYHVYNCMKNKEVDDTSQGADKNGGAASAISETKSVNGVCRVSLCHKIRQKLEAQKSGRESFNLDEMWESSKLWDSIRDYLGKVFTPHVDENSEVALSICLESIGAAAWSDISTRFSSLVTSQRSGANSDSPRHASSIRRTSRGNVAVGVGGDLVLLSFGSSGALVTDHGTQPAHAARTGTLVTDHGAQTTGIRSGSRSASRHGSESNSSIPDYVEGAFSEYMTEEPWQIPTFDDAAVSGTGGVSSTQQALGQRSPEVVHYLNGNGSDQLPAALFQSSFTSIQPVGAAISLFDEMYAPDSLPAFPVKSEGQEAITLGKGHVAYGDRRHLADIAAYWAELRDQYKNDEIKLDKKFWEGIILAEYMTILCLDEGEYIKHKQWERSLFLGSGISGKTYLAVDGRTGHFFCVKKVPLPKFRPDEMTNWSMLEHSNIVKLYGVLRRGQKIYFLEEFIDGGSLQQHIETCQRLSVKMSLQYLRQILQALVYLQQKSVLHEDIKADNILLRAQSLDLVLVDFGSSRQLPLDNPFVPAGENPVGGATQWSPEKAASEGHSFPAEVWAACCCLLHMITGSPPWVKRYPTAGTLHFIIKIQAPPIEDIPADLDARLKDLFNQGWNRNISKRWTAQQLLSHSAFQILGEKPLPKGRVASLSEAEVVDIPSNQARSQSLASHSSFMNNRIPAYKLKEQNASSLAEMALSLVSDVDGYLVSTDSLMTNRSISSARDDERIGTPVKVKKPKTKSPTSAEKQPLSIPKMVQRSISNESENNKSFELTDFLQEAGFLDSNPLSTDEEFQSEIKEPNFENLRSFDEAISRPFVPTNDSRSHLPALSIFDTASSSSSKDERSSSSRLFDKPPVMRHSRPNSSSEEIRSSIGHPPPKSPCRKLQLNPQNSSLEANRNQGNLPVLSIFDSTSTSQNSREERKIKAEQVGASRSSERVEVKKSTFATENRGQGSEATSKPDKHKPAQVVTSRETSPSVQRRQLSPRPVRVIRGRQGPPGDSSTRDSFPSSTFEPYDVRERTRILDFEDLYTARQEGQMVGIGAKSKVSTFASPAFDPPNQGKDMPGKDEIKSPEGKSTSGIVMVEAETTGREAGKTIISSPSDEQGSPSSSSSIDSGGVRVSPGGAFAEVKSPSQSPSLSAVHTVPENTSRGSSPVISTAPNVSSSSGPQQPALSPGAPRQPIYEAVICRRADESEPQNEAARSGTAQGEATDDFYEKRDRNGRITPPYHVLEEFSRTYPRNSRQTKDETDSSNTFPREGRTLNTTDPVGRSLSEPAHGHNGRPVSPWDRQSSSNSQKSFEVEQEYHSLLEEFYQDQWSRSSETSFGGFTSMPQIQDDDSPEAETTQIPSTETVVDKDDYDFSNSLEWLNGGYLNSTVAGVRVSFCDEDLIELCSVRIHDTRQSWHEVVLRISAHPTVLQRFPIYTVLRHRHGVSLDLSALVGGQDSHVTVILQPAEDADDWLWRVRENHVEYHSEYRGPFMNI